MNIVELVNVSESYRIKFVKEKKVFWEEVWALNNINLSVRKGEVLGVIGHNGAGKTTLLKLIAGMLIPDKGKVNIYGRVSALMELGAGFNPEFTGKENILLNARIYGLDENRIEQQAEKIIKFAGIGKFIDAPIKYYSQGMYMRLAFALAIFVEPDILLIDDILAVGDEESQRKCIRKIFEFKRAGKAIVLVSHNSDMVRKLCNRVILLEEGKIVRDGTSEQTINYYIQKVQDKKDMPDLEIDKLSLEKTELPASYTISSGSFKLFADIETESLRLYYQDSELTRGAGLHFSFSNSKESFGLFNAEWKVQKISEVRLILTLVYEGVPIIQTWDLRLNGDQTLKVEIELEVNEETFFVDEGIRLELTNEYKSWATRDEKGDFLIRKYVGNVGPVRLKDSKISGIVLNSEHNEFVPNLTFQYSSAPEDRIINIYFVFKMIFEPEFFKIKVKFNIFQFILQRNGCILRIVKDPAHEL